MSDFKKYHCQECEHLYDEAKGDPDSGIAPRHALGRYSRGLGMPDLRRAEKFFQAGELVNRPTRKFSS